MKKTLLAMAITGLFATSAQAATVYDADGTTVDIYGDIEIAYFNDQDKDGEDGVIHFDDADFGFKVGQDIGNGFTVGGVLEISAEDGTAKLGDTYIGIKSADLGSLTFGSQVTLFDDAYIGNDYHFGFQAAFEQDDASDQVIKYTFDKDMYYGGVAYVLGDDMAYDEDYSRWDGNLGLRVAGFDIGGFYGQTDIADSSSSSYVVNVAYALTDLALDLAVTFGGSTDDATTEDGLVFGFAGAYSLDKTTFGLGLASVTPTSDDADLDATLQYFANVGYEFSSNVNAYVEIGGGDDDATELGYAAGMQVTF